MKYNKTSSYSWTKDSIKKLVQLWESATYEDLEKEFGISRDKISTMVYRLRGMGYPIAKKRKIAVMEALITEAMEEIGMRRSLGLKKK